MLEIVSTAGYASRHKLRATGDSLMQVDGPEGFELHVTLMGGAPCGYVRIGGAPASAKLQLGQTITCRDRTQIWTNGESSVLDVYTDPRQ